MAVSDTRSILERSAAGEPRHRDRSAVRHEENTSTRMGSRDVEERSEHPLLHLVERVWAHGQGMVERTSRRFEGVFERGSRPVADVDLPQARVDPHAQAELFSQDLGRLEGADEVGAIQGVELFAGELSCEVAGLLAAEVVERRVRLPLPATRPVPIGLPMSGKNERRRHRD